MKILNFNNQEEWLEARRGKITGTRVKEILVKRGTAEKIGYYEMIAERLATNPQDSFDPMTRGIELEGEALAIFSKETKKKLNTDLVIWQDEDIPEVAISPDAYIDGKKITEAVEAKCLSSARHVEALISQEIPKDHIEQVMWYFVVNPDLETLYMCFFDPRMVVHEFFFLTIMRKKFKNGEIDNLKKAMVDKLCSINKQIDNLTEGTDLTF